MKVAPRYILKNNEEMQLEKEKFNGFTKEYNKEKLDLYKKANIKVKEEK